MSNNTIFQDNHTDDHVDDKIKLYLSKQPTSFFALAGAGSGKTTSLIKALTFIAENKGEYLLTHKKYVAVITYTNAACDEIKRRSNYNPIFKVSTIHSFLWELILNYQNDIKEWVINDIKSDNEKLLLEQSKGRAGSKAQYDREEKINKNKERLLKIESAKRFSYNPNGENYGYDSLSHSQVVKMGAEFIATNETMQKILICRYPIILIDESQDTKKELVDALIKVDESHKENVIIGMFGDTMQKIYMDGKDNLDQVIPKTWARPIKVMNHRSGTRIVNLANAIRSDIDGKEQKSRNDAKQSVVRLFIANTSLDKNMVEELVYKKMSQICNDDDWLNISSRKSLILEHHMAAERFGFKKLFEPLNRVASFDTALRDGSLQELSFLHRVILPIIDAYNKGDDFGIASIVEKYSPLLSKHMLKNNNDSSRKVLEYIDNSINKLILLWDEKNIPSCFDIYALLEEIKIFDLPDRIKLALQNKDEDLTDSVIVELKEALKAPFSQLENYYNYINGASAFDTHQGVKGLEFERVAVIMSDQEARGFLFSYDKLFGAKEKTNTDIQNEKDGKDTSVNRTKRLFYVACTRARSSLAIVAYTDNDLAVKETAENNQWFSSDEIEVIKEL